MLELVFVIVILGIVASIGSEMIVKVYDSYIVQRAEHRATLKTELAATQIANRLASAIPGTVFRIKNDDSYESIESDLTGSNGDLYKGLQWVGSDTESFNAAAVPGWSGFCDINTSAKDSLITPGSDLDLTDTIIQNLSESNGTHKTIANATIYFPEDNTTLGIDTGSIGELINLDGNASRIVEHYKLAWSSYALVVKNGDLYLYYNFPPTPAAAINNNTPHSLIMEDVSTFKFRAAGRTIRFKICKQEAISKDVNITACKEKAVF